MTKYNPILSIDGGIRRTEKCVYVRVWEIFCILKTMSLCIKVSLGETEK